MQDAFLQCLMGRSDARSNLYIKTRTCNTLQLNDFSLASEHWFTSRCESKLNACAPFEEPPLGQIVRA